jgi:protein ImuB
MQVLAILPSSLEKLRALAEACLIFSPQVALGEEAVFVEISASRKLFSLEECLAQLGKILGDFGVEASVASAADPATAIAFARYRARTREALPVEALGDYLNPFAAHTFSPAPLFRKLGVETLADFLRVPRAELASRFGREGLLAYEKILRAEEVAWPRFSPPEILAERADFDFAAQVNNLEPVLFLLRTILHRIFLRLNARRRKIVEFDLCFHLNRFSASEGRVMEFRLPLPHSDPAALLALLRERMDREFQKKPLGDALEGITVTVLGTAPAFDTQREFFSKAEEEREAWASLVARLRERLGQDSSFLAVPAPRLLPEASWKKTLTQEAGVVVKAPARPLRMFKPTPLERKGDRLRGAERSWVIVGFHGPELLSGEWWLEEFRREYYRVETKTEVLWIFKSEAGLFLHGIFD